MLNTKLDHILSAEEHKKALEENPNLMVCCGRMGPMCIPVYDVMENLEEKYNHVAFRDLAFDSPEGMNIRTLPEVRSFTGLPFVVYFKNGKVAKATSSIQSKGQVTAILDEVFKK